MTTRPAFSFCFETLKEQSLKEKTFALRHNILCVFCFQKTKKVPKTKKSRKKNKEYPMKTSSYICKIICKI